MRGLCCAMHCFCAILRGVTGARDPSDHSTPIEADPNMSLTQPPFKTAAKASLRKSVKKGRAYDTSAKGRLKRLNLLSLTSSPRCQEVAMTRCVVRGLEWL